MRTRIMAMPIAALLSVLLATSSLADDSLPPVSHDGLQLLKNTKLRAVYMKPGARLDQYDKVALLACYVAFAKNWQREHNDEAVDLMDRISDQDMKNIRDHVATEFNKVFTEVLSTKGGHQMVTTGGSGVLIIRPAIINLQVTAPDTMSAGMDMSFSANAGQMTLYMELYDGKSGDIIARIIDPEAAGDDFVQWNNSVTNAADAQRVMRRWVTILNDHLESISAPAAQ